MWALCLAKFDDFVINGKEIHQMHVYCVKQVLHASSLDIYVT